MLPFMASTSGLFLSLSGPKSPISLEGGGMSGHPGKTALKATRLKQEGSKKYTELSLGNHKRTSREPQENHNSLIRFHEEEKTVTSTMGYHKTHYICHKK